jgi:hypothetical protein
LPDGSTVSDGDAEYESLISEWADRWEQRQAKVPHAVSPLSFGHALIEAGISLATIEGMLDASGEAAKWTWQKSTSFRRSHPLVIQFAQALEMSDAEVDAIFVRAKELDSGL